MRKLELWICGNFQKKTIPKLSHLTKTETSLVIWLNIITIVARSVRLFSVLFWGHSVCVRRNTFDGYQFAMNTRISCASSRHFICSMYVCELFRLGLYHAASVSGGQFSPSVWPHNPATRFRPPSATVVSAEPFSHGTGTLRCLQKEMATYRHWSVSLWRDPDDVSHCRILSPDKTEWRLISATLCGWGRCFLADQLWLMTCIREEDAASSASLA